MTTTDHLIVLQEWDVLDGADLIVAATDALDLARAHGATPDAVHVDMLGDDHGGCSLRLVQRRLTDGSEVYDIVLAPAPCWTVKIEPDGQTRVELRGQDDDGWGKGLGATAKWLQGEG